MRRELTQSQTQGTNVITYVVVDLLTRDLAKRFALYCSVAPNVADWLQ